MPLWTKADFDLAYSMQVERRVGSPRNTSNPVRLHYHEWAIKPLMVRRWRNILQVITPAITLSDRVLIVGAGFGWGVRALRNRIGCAAIGTDTSPYIQAEKNNDDSAEIDAEIIAVGLDPTTGRGLFLRGKIRTLGARAKEAVLDEDMSTLQSRQNIASALGGNPTWIITEDLVSANTTDQEIIDLSNFFDQSTAKKLWLYTPTAVRSSELLNTLTGQKVLEFGTYRIVG